jgi:hypothetical protein
MRVGAMNRKLKVCGAWTVRARRAVPLPFRLIQIGTASLVFLAFIAGGSYAEPGTSKDQELFNQGKILIFDKNWDGARSIFQRVIREHPESNLVPQAYYFTARCFQFQGKESDAIRAYETFLQKYPSEPVLPPQAKNAIVELSASLLEKGDSTYRDRLISALKDAGTEVRYFAAIRCSGLKDRQIVSASVPILREILRSGGDRDLVDRARIALLRLDPEALAPEKTPRPKGNKPSNGSAGRMFHLEVYKEGSREPNVELNLPMALAEFAVKALDESTKKEMRKQGFDVENIWQSFKQLGPMKILTLRDGDNLVKIWID